MSQFEYRKVPPKNDSVLITLPIVVSFDMHKPLL